MIRILLLTSVLVYLIDKLQFDLHMFQQNSYRNKRYFRWLKGAHNRFIKGNDNMIMVSALLYGGSAYVKDTPSTLLGLMSLVFVVFALKGHRLLVSVRDVKKKLVYTPRVKRLVATASMISGLCILLLYNANDLLLALCIYLLSTLSFGIIMLSKLINTPIENHINKWYYNDAKRILAENPNRIVIGITGSYGKTSTKNVIAQTLSRDYNVLATPASYNTLMGVIRTIREEMKPTHQVFIAEMGAREPGDIKEICDLVMPDFGIITSIGPQHLETFKTIENIAKTKGEMFEGIKPGGKAFVNLADERIKNLPRRSDIDYIGFGENGFECEETGKCYLSKNLNISGDGTGFDFCFPSGITLCVNTKLLGAHNVSNVLCALSVANELNADMFRIMSSLSDIRPTEHRLSLRKGRKGQVIIDDAFNSNPIGSKNALKVLKAMEGERKFIITPGMIELGDQQDELNKQFGQYIASDCDYVVLVGKNQTRPIQEGLKEAHFDFSKVHIADTFLSGYEHLESIMNANDVLLIENDLPDAFNE
ncbi:UDP-N-acetylmuramoyl-tripeptide--D-alanyl-D-alanine ligase [Fusibacter sp. JL216-2]|uniref:UDP-N-acetylmuramoyl-tripeptide--D-alanyl-D- alanine ligase n=1 Tax=Fusibacter sp. JL216-2 TaxID=3071453 RepID=UPI003D32E6E1